METKKIINRLKEAPHFDKLKFLYLYGSLVTAKRTERSDIHICLYYDVGIKKN